VPSYYHKLIAHEEKKSEIDIMGTQPDIIPGVHAGPMNEGGGEYLLSLVKKYGPVFAMIMREGTPPVYTAHSREYADVILSKDLATKPVARLKQSMMMVGGNDSGTSHSAMVGSGHSQQKGIVTKDFRELGEMSAQYALEATNNALAEVKSGEQIDVHEFLGRIVVEWGGKTLLGISYEEAERISVGTEAAIKVMQLIARGQAADPELVQLTKISDQTIAESLERAKQGVGADRPYFALQLAQDNRLNDVQRLAELKSNFLAMKPNIRTTTVMLLRCLVENPGYAEAFKADLEGKEITAETVHGMPNVMANLKELPRYFPSTWELLRLQAVEDIDLGQYTIPADGLLSISPYVIQRTDDSTANPDKYDPTRWLNGYRPQRNGLLYLSSGQFYCSGADLNHVVQAMVPTTIMQKANLEMVDPGVIVWDAVAWVKGMKVLFS
jgi:cytochrome P450